MNEYQAPREDAPAVDPDVDEATLQRGLSYARPVAVGLFFCALVHAGTTLQILLFAWRQSPGIVVAELAGALWTVLFIAVGARIYDGSYAFTFAGVAVSFAAALSSVVWFVAMFVFSGALSFMPPMAAAGSALCGVACLVLLPFTAQVAAARRRLFE